jgi:hypothetical protein
LEKNAMKFRITIIAFCGILTAGLLIAGCTKESDPVTSPTDHFEPEGLVILGESKDTLAYYFQGVLRAGDALRTTTDSASSMRCRIVFLDSGKQAMTPPTDTAHKLGWTIADPAIAELLRNSGEEYSFRLRGKAPGLTSITLFIVHGDHPDFTALPIPLLVTQ